MNIIILIGRLTRDPELRVTSTGKTVTSFSLAVDRKFATGDVKTDFFRVNVWGKTAEYVSNYATKGRLMAIEGRIESRKYTDKNGAEREVMEVTAEQASLLDRPRDDETSKPTKPADKPAATVNQEFDPFADE